MTSEDRIRIQRMDTGGSPQDSNTTARVELPGGVAVGRRVSGSGQRLYSDLDPDLGLRLGLAVGIFCLLLES